jgi:hypothetical protein
MKSNSEGMVRETTEELIPVFARSMTRWDTGITPEQNWATDRNWRIQLHLLTMENGRKSVGKDTNLFYIMQHVTGTT